VGVKKCFKKGLVFGIIALFILSGTISAVSGSQKDGSYIKSSIGGLGAATCIWTFYIGECLEFIPVNVTTWVEGVGVIDTGQNSVILYGKNNYWVRTKVPFGIGPAKIIVELYYVEKPCSMLERKECYAFIVGPFVKVLNSLN